MNGYAAIIAETARRYEIDPDGEVPALGLPGVVTGGAGAQTSETVYVDTSGLHLARAGLTMCSRTGGDDPGWHLDGPGVDTRLPLGDGTPPEPLLALITAYTRGRDLGPVATVTTVRRELAEGGTVLAHVTDDRGETPAGRWREVAVEPAGGARPGLLDEVDAHLRAHGLSRSPYGSTLARLLGADAPAPLQVGGTSTAGAAVLAYVRTQVDQLLHHDIRARGDGEDAVHQMRVAGRRVRSALRVYGGVVGRGRTRLVDAELAWLGRHLAPARDLEVMSARQRDELDALPPELVSGPVHARLCDHFGAAEVDARRAVEDTLTDGRYLRLLDSLDLLLADPPLTARAANPAAEELPRHVRRAYRRVARRVAGIDGAAARDETLHDTRKAAKRLRYACEVAVPVLGAEADETRRRAKALTEVLGEHQDAVVARGVVRDLAAAAHSAGEDGFTFGVLHERETARAHEAERAFAETWRRLSAKSHRRWFTR